MMLETFEQLASQAAKGQEEQAWSEAQPNRRSHQANRTAKTTL